MIEPLHGVTRDTARPGRTAGTRRSTPGDTPRTTSYVAGPSSSSNLAGPSSSSYVAGPLPSSYVAGPLPSRPATPPAGPDLQDHRYAALAAWSASAETITMAAVEVGPGPAYPQMSVTNPEGGAHRRAAPPAVAAPRRLRIAMPAALAVLAVLVLLAVVWRP